ncbi:hypothetical protein SAMN05661096_03829 [Marivirga sericea]|uniref:Uncharacterized protein n=1 Tax=Marivirga sericea TaxID=1028 RepID=A0A1X7LDL4_9BACT|nr:hypothetical protein [Marivirga sericea]SMG51865.1 hypothetical protein SAMN05661096_03829 [Marivirga sericea]
MKKLIVMLALMLAGTFGFAESESNDATKNATDVKIENVELSQPIGAEEVCGFDVSFDTAEFGSGSFWMSCDDSTTTGDILDILLAMFW